MIYSQEVSNMTCVAKGIEKHGPAPIPEEGKWVQAKEIIDSEIESLIASDPDYENAVELL